MASGRSARILGMLNIDMKAKNSTSSDDTKMVEENSSEMHAESTIFADGILNIDTRPMKGQNSTGNFSQHSPIPDKNDYDPPRPIPTEDIVESVESELPTKETGKYKKANPIYVPDQYAVIIRQAKKNRKGYEVIELCFRDIIDLKKLASELYINIPREVKFSNLRVLRLQKSNPNTLLYKYSFSEATFMEAQIINLRKNIQFNKISLIPAFINKPTISEAKKKGLIELIEKKSVFPLTI